MVYRRLIESRVNAALADTPVVLVIGPRRAGKTTLVRSLAEPDRSYLTLDDPTVFAAANDDPVNFIRNLDRVIIDEVQRVPKLLLAIKKSVDEDYQPGRFLLTGSANILTLPKVADSLAGRMETIRLLPFAQVELHNRQPSFLDRLFSGDFFDIDATVGNDLITQVLKGGFPEAITRDETRRQVWSRSYLKSVLTRDLKDISEIEKLTELPVFVRLLASHAGQLVNFSSLGESIGVTHKTSRRYLELLSQIFVVTLRPWHINT